MGYDFRFTINIYYHPALSETYIYKGLNLYRMIYKRILLFCLLLISGLSASQVIN